MSEGKRRWFQLHLSTCVVLMFAMGFCIWAYLDLIPIAMDEITHHGDRFGYFLVAVYWACYLLPLVLMLGVQCFEFSIRRRERKQQELQE